MTDEDYDDFVERIRVASFEAPRASSHSQWRARIISILRDVRSFDPDRGPCLCGDYDVTDPASTPPHPNCPYHGGKL